jgi:hypothetical protein
MLRQSLVDAGERIWSPSSHMTLKDITVEAESSSLKIDGDGEQALISATGATLTEPHCQPGAVAKRIPGELKGRITIHEDFDELPSDLAAAFGIEP